MQQYLNKSTFGYWDKHQTQGKQCPQMKCKALAMGDQFCCDTLNTAMLRRVQVICESKSPDICIQIGDEELDNSCLGIASRRDSIKIEMINTAKTDCFL